MASGSTTPVSSANSYSDADVRAQSVWQAEVNKLKVAQLDELLNAKDVKPNGDQAGEGHGSGVALHEGGDRRVAREAAGGAPAAGAPAHAAPSLEDSGGLLPAEVRAAQTVLAQAYTASLE